MRAVIQRVSEASVSIDGKVKSSIGKGILIFLGIEDSDTEEDIDWLCAKISKLRIFPDENGSMNISLEDSAGEILLISQFTLHASVKKGNRPSFIRAARPETAIPLYEKFIGKLEAYTSNKVHTGEFGADMKVSLVNDGPVTIWIDTKNRE
ncbi:MAG: D-tyrosyl-tRNA(Tyr) deacylase [Bacteroidetes bacterium]|nr:MAG: D-tyrosyl-tRNA(Tyr) deacylase [Bacteroidota bacterium]REK03541.1 MAG: D-tyrosyl-tRNA(Tyr) deacylase [Bacteroidota bacterium]REK34844.1 MAG: D-tyrosyl-tRNA(Tyr) deacylase [Bacteroidota bacterium]REK51215.1 MAG: D-tyrosyl-tRNA(Tyr) deacylase [Bacteroidota bacterium]